MDTPPSPAALTALQSLLADPTPRVLFGTKAQPGIFTGSTIKTKQAAKDCLDHNWLTGTGTHVGKGKSQKELHRITPLGVKVVLDQANPQDLLQTVAQRLQHTETAAQSGQTRIQEQLAQTQADFEAKFKALREQLQPPDLSAVRDTLCRLQERFKPVDLDELTRKLGASTGATTPAPAAPAPSTAAWFPDALRILASHKQTGALQRLTLAQLYHQLYPSHPSLTIGQFHDGIRQLFDERQIQLGSYTLALATLDEPRLALYLNQEVKYYVELA